MTAFIQADNALHRELHRLIRHDEDRLELAIALGGVLWEFDQHTRGECAPRPGDKFAACGFCVPA